jgi:hypothetical protein
MKVAIILEKYIQREGEREKVEMNLLKVLCRTC